MVLWLGCESSELGVGELWENGRVLMGEGFPKQISTAKLGRIGLHLHAGDTCARMVNEICINA